MAREGKEDRAGVSADTSFPSTWPSHSHVPPHYSLSWLCLVYMEADMTQSRRRRRRRRGQARESMGKLALCGEPFGRRGVSLSLVICEMGMSSPFQC